MGCPSQVEIGDNLVFSINTHDPDTGVLTDADAAPAYRIYKDETSTPILTGTMAKLDDAGTVGFYTELVACTAGNGFENGQTYTVYITAIVDSDTGGISYGFKAITPIATQIRAQVVAALTVDTYVEPGQGAPPAATTIANKIGYPYKFWRNKNTRNDSEMKVYNDAEDTVDQKAAISDDRSTYTKGEYKTGP